MRRLSLLLSLGLFLLAGDAAAQALVDVSITKTPTGTSGLSGTFSMVVTNAGPSTATNVVVSDTLPAGMTTPGATSTVGSCSGTSTITCNIGSLAPAASATITVPVNVTGAGAYVNTATVSSTEPDSNQGNNIAVATIIFDGGPAVPALSPTMLALLAAVLGAGALLILRR